VVDLDPQVVVVDPEPQAGKPASSPQVAIVVTSKDRDDLLGLALRSVQLQQFENWECIVVDDASLDNAVAVAQAFAEVDPRFRVLTHAECRGLSAARNTGIADATAPYVIFLDDDDLLMPGTIESRLLAVAATPADVAGSYSDWMTIDVDRGLDVLLASGKAARRTNISFSDLASGTPFPASSPMVRTEVVRSVGGFDVTRDRAEDADLWSRVMRRGFRFVFAGDVGVAYRRTPGSLSLGNPEAQLESTLQVRRREDASQPDICDEYPLADPRSLSAVSFEARIAPVVLRYAALVALNDPGRGREICERELSEQYRRGIDVGAQTSALTGYVTGRLVERYPHDVDVVRGRVVDLLQSVVPPITVDPLPRRRERGPRHSLAPGTRRIVPRPLPTSDTATEIDGSVVLIAEARYHVDELGPLHDVLQERGVKVRFMQAPLTVEPALRAIGEYTNRILPFAPDLIGRSAAVVVLNDWAGLAEVVRVAGDAGVPTFAKVEGVQDFDDVDTERERRPYRNAAVILGQGQNDAEALPDKRVEIVGSTRLERIWHSPGVPGGDDALVNLNFTYSVLSNARERWLTSVVEAVRRAAIPAIVSCHPAERVHDLDLPLTPKPFRYAITQAGVLISRLSTVPFEAMGRGVPFIYHNPHGELVPTFTEPLDAFPITTSVDELVEALHEMRAWRSDYRSRAEKFFLRQVDVHPDIASEQRTADLICRVIAG
jgi:hypothetical protein